MAVHKLPWLSHVTLTRWDYLNLVLGLVIIVFNPLWQVFVTDGTTPRFLLIGMVGIGLVIWSVTLWMGRKMYQIRQHLQTAENCST